MEDLGTEGRKPSGIFGVLCVLTLSVPILLASCSMGWFGEGAGGEEEPLESRYPIEDDDYPTREAVSDQPPESSGAEKAAATGEAPESDTENASTDDEGSEEDPVATRVARDSDSLEEQSSNVAAESGSESTISGDGGASMTSELGSGTDGLEGVETIGEAQGAVRTAELSSSEEAAVSPPLRREIAAVIYFGHGSTALNENDRAVLRGVVALQRHYQSRLRVVGHASKRTNVSSAEVHRIANFNASLRRASRVGDALVRMGVDPALVTTEARSDSEPVYFEFMPTGEAGNRRVEIYLEY